MKNRKKTIVIVLVVLIVSVNMYHLFHYFGRLDIARLSKDYPSILPGMPLDGSSVDFVDTTRHLSTEDSFRKIIETHGSDGICVLVDYYLSMGIYDGQRLKLLNDTIRKSIADKNVSFRKNDVAKINSYVESFLSDINNKNEGDVFESFRLLHLIDPDSKDAINDYFMKIDNRELRMSLEKRMNSFLDKPQDTSGE